jgi:hypothetical protein
MTASEPSVSLPDTAGVPWTSPALLAILAATLMTSHVHEQGPVSG